MSLILNNSRDVGNKFLFGHWMMRPKGGQRPFSGPGFGRINFWQCDLSEVEEDMKLMKKMNLRCYVIEMTGKLQLGDGCWDCCKNDRKNELIDSGGEEGKIRQIIWAETHYFSQDWYNEVASKYKALLSLCRKYNIWLLNLVFNDNQWQNTKPHGRWSNWVEEWETKPDLDDGRKQELRSAIAELLPLDIPTLEQIKKLITDVIIPAGNKNLVVVCPVNEPETEQGHQLEEFGINELKLAGFTTCVYRHSKSEDRNGAKMYQGGHNSSIASVTCEGGIGVSDNGDLLVELYYSTPGETHIWEKIGGNQKAIPDRVKTMIKNYKKSKAIAAILYAIHYGKGGHVGPDVEALKAIRQGWYS